PEGRYPTLAMTPQRKREATLDAIAGWLFVLAESKPVLQVCENLHWADPTTLELLGLYIGQSPTVSMLSVYTYRPEFVPAWSMRSHMTPITLNRLERPEVETFVSNLAQGKSLPREVLEHIVSKADGVPLYIEELTKTILDSDLLREEEDQYLLDGPLAQMRIPSTLQDSLMARLDRAPELREVAQMAAVLGREFAYEMLHAVMALEESVLQSGLEQLVDDELLYQRGRPPRSRYTFKHALIRDSAYQSLLHRTRQQHHQRVAELLESQYQETGRGHSELIAQHLTAAGQHTAAVKHWQQAGQNALDHSALREAMGHFSEALSVIAKLPESTQRDTQELDLQLALGGAFQVAEGFTSAAAQAAYERALLLCQLLGDTERLYSVQMGLWRTRVIRRPNEEALHLALDLLTRAKAEGSLVAQMIGEYICGFTRLLRGELARATQHFDIIMREYRPEFRDSALYVTGHDPHEAASAYQAWNAWLQGEPEQARRLCMQAVEIAHASARPPAVAHALLFVALVHQLLDEPASVLEHVELNRAHCAEHDIKQWHGVLSLLEAWSRHRLGLSKGVTSQMKQGIALWAGSDGTAIVPYLSTILIETLNEEGATEEALTTANEAIQLAEQIGERMSLPELHRLRGEALLHSDHKAARHSFEQALSIAGEIGAKGWEQRVIKSISAMENFGPARHRHVDEACL
ncbi:MAG: putative ATPase, partial [Gammaproteobacteria bacterium]